MAGINIKNIPDAKSVNNNDNIIIEQTEGTKKSTVEKIVNAVVGNDVKNVKESVESLNSKVETIEPKIKEWDNFKSKGGSINGDLDIVKNGITSRVGYSSFTPVCSSWTVKGGIIESPIGVNLAIQPGEWSALVPFKHGELNLGTPSYRYLDLYLVNPPNVSSKRELKENINIFNDNKAYEGIKNLNIYTYNFIDGKGEDMLGSIYDELPIECINEKAEGVDLYAYTSYAISALKIAINKIEELEKQINKMKETQSQG